MTRINLLPWREEQRKERQKQFIAVMVVTLVISLVTVGIIHVIYAGHIQNQKARNNLLSAEIAHLEKKIRQIAELEKEKANLLARMNIIQQLQLARPEVVHVFDELVTTLPEGVYISALQNTGKKINITGVAQSNGRVSTYMKNVDASAWLSSPTLTVIKTKDKGTAQVAGRSSTFILDTNQTTPVAADEAQPSKAKSK
jgi:type IV pilus assembly protein PilN